MDDFLLIQRMKQGDETAFDVFVRKYYGQMLQYCRYHCFDRETAEDLTQDTFLKFFENLRNYRHMGKAKNYLYTIAGNLCKNHAKKQIPMPAEPDVLEQNGFMKDCMKETENRLLTEQALKELAPELREVIILFYLQECKLKEIAGILDIGLPLVKYRLKKAREELKQLIGKEETYEQRNETR